MRMLDRAPDDAKIKAKMVFASSKDALRRALVGIAVEIQGTDFSEVAYEAGASPLDSFRPRCVLIAAQYSTNATKAHNDAVISCSFHLPRRLFSSPKEPNLNVES
jgi:hypothetical protein